MPAINESMRAVLAQLKEKLVQSRRDTAPAVQDMLALLPKVPDPQANPQTVVFLEMDDGTFEIPKEGETTDTTHIGEGLGNVALSGMELDEFMANAGVLVDIFERDGDNTQFQAQLADLIKSTRDSLCRRTVASMRLVAQIAMRARQFFDMFEIVRRAVEGYATLINRMTILR